RDGVAPERRSTRDDHQRSPDGGRDPGAAAAAPGDAGAGPVRRDLGDARAHGRLGRGQRARPGDLRVLAGRVLPAAAHQPRLRGDAVEGLEVIGYDPASGTYPSTVYPSMVGTAIPYRWEIDGDELTITTDVVGAVFRGRWSADGATFAGAWRPLP